MEELTLSAKPKPGDILIIGGKTAEVQAAWPTHTPGPSPSKQPVNGWNVVVKFPDGSCPVFVFRRGPKRGE